MKRWEQLAAAINIFKQVNTQIGKKRGYQSKIN